LEWDSRSEAEEGKIGSVRRVVIGMERAATEMGQVELGADSQSGLVVRSRNRIRFGTIGIYVDLKFVSYKSAYNR
jgi:hypothetical protein